MCGYINGSCMSIFPHADRSPNKNTPDAALLIQCCYNTITKARNSQHNQQFSTTLCTYDSNEPFLL